MATSHFKFHKKLIQIVFKAQTSIGNKKVRFLVATLTDCIHNRHLNLHMEALCPPRHPLPAPLQQLCTYYLRGTSVQQDQGEFSRLQFVFYLGVRVLSMYVYKKQIGIFTTYRKIASSNTSRLEAHAGFFRLLTAL